MKTFLSNAGLGLAVLVTVMIALFAGFVLVTYDDARAAMAWRKRQSRSTR